MFGYRQEAIMTEGIEMSRVATTILKVNIAETVVLRIYITMVIGIKHRDGARSTHLQHTVHHGFEVVRIHIVISPHPWREEKQLYAWVAVYQSIAQFCQFFSKQINTNTV